MWSTHRVTLQEGKEITYCPTTEQLYTIRQLTKVSFKLGVGALEQVCGLHQAPLLAPQSAGYSVSLPVLLLQTAYILRFSLHPRVRFSRHAFTVACYSEVVFGEKLRFNDKQND